MTKAMLSIEDAALLLNVGRDCLEGLLDGALPVCRWQSRQWQQCMNIGGERSS